MLRALALASAACLLPASMLAQGKLYDINPGLWRTDALIIVDDEEDGFADEMCMAPAEAFLVLQDFADMVTLDGACRVTGSTIKDIEADISIACTDSSVATAEILAMVSPDQILAVADAQFLNEDGTTTAGIIDVEFTHLGDCPAE